MLNAAQKAEFGALLREGPDPETHGVVRWRRVDLPDDSGFRTSRNLSAWLGLTPNPHSSGGKERLGRISKMGNRNLRRLLYLGAMGVITARRRGSPGDDWLWHLLQRKTAKQAANALASGMARSAVLAV